MYMIYVFFFFQEEDGIRDVAVTGVQTCALPIYYRLNVFPIQIPALRERHEDIPLLVRYFVQRFSRSLNKEVQYIPADAMEALERYSWPGNVRELENLIERAVLLSPGKELCIPLSELKDASGSAAAPGAEARSEERRVGKEC